MKSFLILTIVAGVLSNASVQAQDTVETAAADLKKAVGELSATQKEYAELRRALYRDINQLDDEALELGRELRKLVRDEERRTATIKTLEREI